MASGIEYACTFLSLFFRLAAYVFLRVIPARFLVPLLPAVYAAYTICYWLSPISPAPSPVSVVQVDTQEKEAASTVGEGNGTIKTVKPDPPKHPSSLLTILLSLPSPLRRQRLLNFAINTLLLNCAVDFVTYPLFDSAKDVRFTRVGAVNPDSVKLAVRYPFANATEGTVQIVWRQTSDSVTETAAWKDGPFVSLNQVSDWTTTVTLSGLWPSTSYEYRLVDGQKYMLPVPAQPIPFKTFPDPRLPVGNHFRFVVSSCTVPNFPYRPFKGRLIPGYDLLFNYLWPSKAVPDIDPEALSMEDVVLGNEPYVPPATAAEFSSSDTPAPTLESEIAPDTVSETEVANDADRMSAPVSSDTKTVDEEPPRTEFMLFLGDFIYADVPLYFGDNKEAYRRLYRRNYNSPSMRKVYEKLPMFHVYDDHEIINNYAGMNRDVPPFPNASDAYTLYNSAANYDSPKVGEHYYNFRYGDVAFFVMDTRKHRSDYFTEDAATRTMLGETQLTALHEWLGSVNTTATFKFIVSSVPVSSLWTMEGTYDSWAGFMTERASLLEALHTVPNVIVLSGDRHEAAVIEFNAPDQNAYPIYEISTSPLSMFYVPFVRTLKRQSEAMVSRVRKLVEKGEEGLEMVAETTIQVPQERVMKYVPIGNHKWSSIEVDTRDLQNPVAKLEIMSDGRPAYNLEIIGTPVELKAPSALGSIAPESINKLSQFLDKIGLKPSKWF